MQKTTLKNILIFFGTIVLVVLFFGIGSKNEINQLASVGETQKIDSEKIVKTQEFVLEKVVEPPRIEENNNEENLEIFYPVIKVVDGDTLTINMNGQNQTLRLIGIDTPETVDPRKPVQCFGVEASNKAKEVLTGQKVRIEKDSGQGELDKYGRLLAYVFLEDGTNFNKMMIEQGYAYEYTYDLPYKYQTEFKSAEEIARTEKRGLWAEDTCNGDATKAQEIPIVEQNDPITPSNPTTISKPIKSDCSSNVYNCTDFKTHAEAQATYEYCGGVNNDIHRLDQDKDGEACESLP